MLWEFFVSGVVFVWFIVGWSVGRLFFWRGFVCLFGVLCCFGLIVCLVVCGVWLLGKLLFVFFGFG